jgi:hypothetical protein
MIYPLLIKVLSKINIKTEELKLKHTKLIKKNVNITFNINVNNMNNLTNNVLSVSTARRLFSKDIPKLIQNILKHQYSCLT